MKVYDTELVSAEVAEAAVRRPGQALGWDVARHRVSAPVLVDGEPVWDLAVLRRELATYRRRALQQHPRWSRRTHERITREHAAAAARREHATRTVAVDELAEDLVGVRTGLGQMLGYVFRGQTLTGRDVWLVQPLSRVGHAATWDLPCTASREAAVAMLVDGVVL